jgi:hypothetical protein
MARRWPACSVSIELAPQPSCGFHWEAAASLPPPPRCRRSLTASALRCCLPALQFDPSEIIEVRITWDSCA